jgi:hypothetical protein
LGDDLGPAVAGDIGDREVRVAPVLGELAGRARGGLEALDAHQHGVVRVASQDHELRVPSPAIVRIVARRDNRGATREFCHGVYAAITTFSASFASAAAKTS